MVKKTTAKTTKKKSSIVKKKPKSKIKPKSSPFKSKLGHDPLAWITGEDASELGVRFDELDSKLSNSSSQVDQILPAVDSQDHQGNQAVPLPEDVSVSEEETSVEPVVSTVEAIDSDDGSWGLFGDDEPEEKSIAVEARVESVDSDDGSWGLFGNDGQEEKSLPVGEGIAWGLFSDESGADADVDHDAIIIHLPATFNVSEIRKVYHDFDDHILKDHDIVVDASDVETIDATGLQLLFACQKELQKRGCKMVIKDASAKAELLSSSSFINELLGMAG